MPNWTFNTLSVSGNEEILADFVSKTIIPSTENDYDNRGKFTFNILHPIPEPLRGEFSPLRMNEGETEEEYKERLEENKRLYGATDWYDWSVANWGTKWNACHSQVEEVEDDYLNVRFDTAWSPPLDWFYKIIPMFPELDFDLIFDMEGDDNCGLMTGRNGEWNLEWDYKYYVDEDGIRLEYNIENGKWFYPDTKEVIDDEDFYPIDVNPFA